MRKVICLLFLLNTINLQAQEGAFNIRTGDTLSVEAWKAALPDQFNLFDSDEPLELTIESDYKKLNKEKNNDEYQKAFLHYQLNDSIVIKRKIRIKPRGEFRKKYCYFPPIRLNFKKTEFFVEDLRDLEKMKMVTHCRGGSDFEKYILKEYLVYKLFNLFTDLSFNARLLKVKYVDTGRKNKTQDTWAFLIEENDKMAARHGGALMENQKLSQPNMEDQHMTLVAVFEYMIGNTDWSIPGQHNVKLLKFLDLNKPAPYPVPYDFDYSGFVNASYAVPPEGLGLNNVRERRFLGYCRTAEEFQNVFNYFLEREEDVYQTITNFPYLGKKEKADLIKFIQTFYKNIKLPKASSRLFQSSCKNLQ